MTDIPLYPANHHKKHKLTEKEQGESDKQPSGSVLTRGWEKKSKKDKCHYREVSRDLQNKYPKTIYPVCPVLRKWIKEKEDNRLAVTAEALEEIKKQVRSSGITAFIMWNSIVRILKVFESLIKLKPDLDTVVGCAHTDNILTGRLDLIRNDLLSLPQALERDFPNTSKECKELVAAIQLAEYRYVMHGSSLVYLLPENLEYGNWVTFLEWRERQVNCFRPNDFSAEIDMCRLTRHYPAEAIKVMREIHKKLSPLLQILLDKTKEHNHLQTNIRKILDKHLVKEAEIKQDEAIKAVRDKINSDYDRKELIEVNLSLFNKSGSKRLLENLIRLPAGVECDEESFGKKQPGQLKEVLRNKDHQYEKLANHIHKQKEKIVLDGKIVLKAKK